MRFRFDVISRWDRMILYLSKIRRHIEGEPTISGHKRLRLRGLRFSHNANTVFIRLEGDNAIISHTETLLLPAK